MVPIWSPGILDPATLAASLRLLRILLSADWLESLLACGLPPLFRSQPIKATPPRPSDADKSQCRCFRITISFAVGLNSRGYTPARYEKVANDKPSCSILRRKGLYSRRLPWLSPLVGHFA